MLGFEYVFQPLLDGSVLLGNYLYGFLHVFLATVFRKTLHFINLVVLSNEQARAGFGRFGNTF